MNHLWLWHDVQEVEDAALALPRALPLAKHCDCPVHCRLAVVAVVDWDEVVLAAGPFRPIHRQQRPMDLFCVRRLQRQAW